jgi:hypothetical protein
MSRACRTNGEEKECIWNIGERARKKELLRRPRCRRVGNIIIDHREIGRNGMDSRSVSRNEITHISKHSNVLDMHMHTHMYSFTLVTKHRVS